MEKNRKNKITKALVSTMLTTGVVATTFGFAFDAFKTHNSKSYANVLAGDAQALYATSAMPVVQAPAAAPAAGLNPYVAHATNIAPSTLYVLNAINVDKNTGWQNLGNAPGINAARDIVAGLRSIDAPATITKAFMDKFRDAFLGQLAGGDFLKMDTRYMNDFSEAIKFFSDPIIVAEQFQKLNQMSQTADELKIFQPGDVYDVQVLGEPHQTTGTTKYSQLRNQIEYLVGKINTVAIKDKDVDLDYKITDAESPSTEYHLVMKNHGNSLISKLEGGATVKDLIASKDIIVRNVSTPYDNAAPVAPAPLGKFKLDYDTTSKMINIVAIPSASNHSEATALTFKSANDDTQKVTVTGFLDSSLSPLHNPDDQIKNINQHGPVLYNAQSAGSPFVYAASSTPTINATTHEEELTFYMGVDEKMSFDLQFQGDSSVASWAGTHTVDLTFDGTNVKTKNFSVNLTKGKQANGTSTFKWDFTVEQVNGAPFARVTVKADGTNITFNQTTVPGTFDPVEIKDYPAKIFFEELLQNPSTNIQQGSVAIRESTDVTDKYRQYIQAVYANWFDIQENRPEDKGAWVVNHQSTETDRNSRVFDFEYDYYFIKNDGIVKSDLSKNGLLSAMEETIRNKRLLVHDMDKDKAFAPLKSANGDWSTQVASGENAAKLLSIYFNFLREWLVGRLGVTETVKESDYYDPTNDASKLGSFIETHILANAGQAKIDLINHANALVALAWGGNIGGEEQKYIDDLDKRTILGRQMISSLIGGKIKYTTSPGQNGVKSSIVQWDADGILANQLIIKILEEDMIKVVQELFNNENEMFKSYYSTLLGSAMKLYLSGQSGDYRAIAGNALTQISDENLPNVLKGSGLVAINGEPNKMVHNGRDQLQSLLDFIFKFNLQDKYLKDDAQKINDFNQFYKDGLLLKADVYDSDSQRGNVGRMLAIVDEIVTNIIGRDARNDVETLEQLASEIQLAKSTVAGNNKNGDAASKIKQTLDILISKITNTQSSATQYHILSESYQASYLENIVMGKNLSIIRNKWMEAHGHSSAISLFDTYNPVSLTSMAVSLGYYNFDYFINALTVEQNVPETAVQLLDADWTKTVRFTIPKTNSIINLMSNPHTLIAYGAAGAGVLISIAGVSALAISVNKVSKRNATSRRGVVSMRLVFAAMAVIGIAVAIMGFLI